MDLSRSKKTLLSLVFLPYRVVLTSLKRETLTPYLSPVIRQLPARHQVPLLLVPLSMQQILLQMS